MHDRSAEEVLREIVDRHRRLRGTPLRGDQTLAGDLGFDSLAFLMLLTDLEQAFDLEFPVERIDELQTLTFGDLVRLVRTRLERTLAAP